MTNKDVRSFVISWSSRFPVDRWWRKKYNIAFNSPSHRESNFIDQIIEYQEDKLYAELNEKTEEYQPNTSNWLKHTVGSQDDEIESLRNEFQDLEEFPDDRQND